MQSVKLSALDHLKSELLRKKEDAERNKRSIDEHQPKPFPQTEKEALPKEDNVRKELPELTSDEAEKAKKARVILEAKAKLYDSLTEGVHMTKNSNLYLVNFEKKAAEDPLTPKAGSALSSGKIIDLAQIIKEDSIACEANNHSQHGSSTESRKEEPKLETCSDKELLSKARNLSKPDASHAAAILKGTSDSGEPTLVSADMQRERIRQKWEEDERLARSKDDIHYQDILFDEVRSHGVGYFAFSKDEDERRQQQAELEEMRKETLKKQEEFRRQQGIIDNETNSSGFSEPIAAQGEPSKELTEEEKLKNIEEALRSIRREVHVREWDKGKDVPVLSQEEWIEKKREERDNDFAPPAIYFEDQSGAKNRKRPIKGPTHNILFKRVPKTSEEQKNAAVDLNDIQLPDNALPESETNSISQEPTNVPLSNHSLNAEYLSSHSSKNENHSPITSNKTPSSNLSKTVKNAKKSAMALLEQLMNSKSDAEEVPASGTSEKSMSVGESVESIPLPPNGVAISTSENIRNHPVVTPAQTAKSNQSAESKKPFFIPFNLIPKKFTAKAKPTTQQVLSSASLNSSSVLNVPQPSTGANHVELPESSCTNVSNSLEAARSSNANIQSRNDFNLPQVSSSTLMNYTYAANVPPTTAGVSNAVSQDSLCGSKVSSSSKGTNVASTTIVPEKNGNSPKVLSCGLLIDKPSVNVAETSAADRYSSLPDSVHRLKATSSFEAEKISDTFVSSNNDDATNCPKISSDSTACSQNISDTIGPPEQDKTKSEEVKKDVFPAYKGSIVENDKSTIKLGNLIRNRAAPKSGMALLEEIKKSTRDFRYGDELPNDAPPKNRKRGAEIAPPECLLQSTPQLPVQKKGLFTKKQDISDSISAGLENLKSVSEKKKKVREKGMLDIF